MPDPDDAAIVARLRAHNDAMEAMLTEEGLAEIDRMVVLEAVAAARIKATLDDLARGDRGVRIRGEMLNADRQEELQLFLKVPDYVKDLIEKCKNVLNNKIKGLVNSTVGGGDED